MSSRRFFRAGPMSLALALALVLTGCGGGGGGDDASTPAPASGNASAAGAAAAVPAASLTPGNTPAPASTQSVAITGTATFDFVPSASSGQLDYGSTVAKPIRGATVELLGADGTVLVSGATDAAGAYSLPAPASTQVQVRIRAQMVRNDTVRWDFTVRDNTASEALYAIASPLFSSGAGPALKRDVNAPSGWNGTSYATTRAAAPFALLDTVYSNATKVVAAAPSVTFPALRVFWSPANVGAPGEPAKGQIGTTSFIDRGNGSRSIYVLGSADVDTDEYDASVVSHEWGHYYQSAFSRDDSPGGAHAATDRLDRRLAFSEGWGNAWSGIALGRSTYTDSVGPGQSIGYSLDLSASPASNRGWFREGSIQAIFWNLQQLTGFGPIHAAMTGPFKTGLQVTSIHPFAAAFATSAPSQAGTLASLLQRESISGATNQPWGEGETNNGGIALALPLYQAADRPACVTDQAGTANNLGRFAYVRFTLASAGSHRIRVVGPATTDPDIDVFQGGRVAGSYGGAAGVEDAVLNLPAGESVLVIYDANATASCFSVSIV